MQKTSPVNLFRVMIAMYLGYGSMMICRQMLTILSPALLADETLSLSKTDIGDLMACGTIGALTGKFFWGPIGDKIGGGKTFLLALFFSAIGLVQFSNSYNYHSFIVGSFLLYFAQSGGWPGMTKLVGQYFPKETYGKTWSILSTSSRLSVVGGTLLFGSLLQFYSWQEVSLIAVTCTIIMWAVIRWSIPGKPSPLEGAVHETPPFFKVLKGFCTSSRFYLMLGMMMLLTCMMAFLDFIPMYLLEVYGLDQSKASIASATFPFGCLTGLLLASFFYDRIGKKGIRRVLSISLFMAAVMIFILQSLSTIDMLQQYKLYVAVFLIFGYGLLLSPSYYLPSSIFSIEYGKTHSATLICIIDGVSFGASASFNLIGGRLADSSGGWNSFTGLLICITLGAACITWIFLQGEYRISQKTGEKN
jgi:OPA family sugar phosphate sensor protein UhpC-like MFS transporter